MLWYTLGGFAHSQSGVMEDASRHVASGAENGGQHLSTTLCVVVRVRDSSPGKRMELDSPLDSVDKKQYSKIHSKFNMAIKSTNCAATNKYTVCMKG